MKHVCLLVLAVGRAVGVRGAEAEGDGGGAGDEAFLRGMVADGVLPPDFMEAWRVARLARLTRQERFIELEFSHVETSFGVPYTAYCYRDNFLLLEDHLMFRIRSEDRRSGTVVYQGEQHGTYACLERFMSGGGMGVFIAPADITEVVGIISFDSRKRVTTKWACAKQDHPWSDAVFRCSVEREHEVPDLVASPDRALVALNGYRLRSTVDIEGLHVESIEKNVYGLTCWVSADDVKGGVVHPVGDSCDDYLPVEIGQAVVGGYLQGLYCQTANGVTRCGKWTDEK